MFRFLAEVQEEPQSLVLLVKSEKENKSTYNAYVPLKRISILFKDLRMTTMYANTVHIYCAHSHANDIINLGYPALLS